MKKSTVEKDDITKKQLRILFIELSNENTQTAINVIQNTFASCIYKRVESKKDFLAELVEFKPDVIISGLSIPELSCNDILILLSENSLRTPLIIFTGVENEADAIKCVQSGARDYVIKEQPNRLCITLIRALEEKTVDPELIKNADTTNELQEIIDRYLRWEANIPGMLFLIDLKPDFSYSFVQVSSASKEMLGLAPNEIMKDPSLFSSLIDPDDASALVNVSLEAAKSGSPFRFEARFRIYGKLRWFFFISHSELRPDGSVTINGILMDITDKKRAEEAAAKERNLMNILMDNLPDAIYFKDLKSRFIKVNKGCLSKIGAVSENEILMKTDFDIFQFEHALESRNDELEIIKTGKPLINKIEKEIFPSGELKWVSTTKIPIKNKAGDIVGTFGVSRDISEQKHFEESLYTERNLLRTLVDAIPDRIFVKDSEGKYLLNNKAHLNLLGLAKQEETIGKTDYDYVKPEVAARYEAYDKLVIDTGRPLMNHEEQSFDTSGQRGWHLSTKIPLRDNKNKIIGLVGISRDITRSRKIQEQLKSSEARLRHIITAVSAVLYTINIEMDLPGIKGVNLTLVWVGDNIRQFGYEPDHLVKSNLREKLIHPEDIEPIRAKMPILFEKNKLVVEYRIRHKAGHYIWLRDEMVLIRNAVGKPKEIFGSWLEITEQKPDETSASNERNLIQTLMENLPDLIYFKDLESRFIKVNKAYLQKFGIKSENEILMKTDFDLFKSDHANDARDDELKIINTGQGIINKVEKETWRSGKLTWVSSTKLPLKDREGKIIGTFGVSRDITDMVHAEEALAVERNLMSTLINSIPDIIFVEDMDGKFILNNSAHIQSLGVKSQEEAYGKTAFDYYPRDIAMTFINDDLKIIQTGKPILNKEERTYSRVKHNAWHLVTKVPLRNKQNIITGIVCVSRDITKSKETQEQLKNSEARIRQIINTVSAVLYTVKISGATLTPVWVGDNIKQFGYQPKEALSPEWWLDVIHPDDFDYVKSSLKAIDKNDKLLLEFRFKCKDGVYIWLSNETVLIRDNNGKPAELFGSCLDITERMKAQEALLTSEAQLSVAIKIAHLAHWEYDALDKKFLFNDQYYSLLHTSAENAGGYYIPFDRVLDSFVYREDKSIIIREFQKAVKTKDPYYNSEVEFRMNYFDGNIGYFAVSFFIMKDARGITTKCFGVTQDITERKYAEEALRASEYFLRKSQSVAHIGSFKYDIKSGSWESSKTLDEILGISSNYPKNIKGWINLVHPTHRKIVFRIVKKQLLINKRIEREFIIVRQNDKQERWALALADLEFDGEGNPVTLIGTVQDITERILREQERIELSEQLQLRNVELETMVADLKLMQGTLVQTEKMASLGQLTAGIAHEINNPLAFVSSNINRLNEYFQDTVGLLSKWQDLEPVLHDKTDFKVKLQQINEFAKQIDLNFILQDFDKMMQGIHEGTGRIKKIVEGMRGFAHMADNTYSEAHINQAIDDTLTIVWNEIKYKSTIEKKYDDVPAVTCNIGEIKQVLVNLLVNASHAIKEKGTICISTSSDNEYVYIQIQDTGEGIPPENLKRIFDPFFTTKAVGKGTGLGLWISSTIIEKHCGSITVESKIDIGSNFKIKLPIKLKTAHTAVEAATK